ncbi:hypothetical protein KFE25_013035 [Diacronema lutheri]|uniref:Transmembrane and coiled-coil domain-containing protein 4 n=1 Tax=Diacronema lutheri TaxID=2081491 RepID=A0A8J6C3K5_DIALT|nr:hypothetical protein KFE25_013035 [Diacronema lutheri]
MTEDGAPPPPPRRQSNPLSALLTEREHRVAVVGAVTVLLHGGLRSWGSPSRAWARDFLALVARAAGHGHERLDAHLELLDSEGIALDARIFGDLLPVALRPSIPSALLAECVSIGEGAQYDARARQVLKGLCLALDVPIDGFYLAEELLALRLCEAAADRASQHRATDSDERGERARAAGGSRWARRLGLLTLAAAGGASVALTAGLAAPAFGMGLIAVGGLGGATVGAAVAPVGAWLASTAGAATFGTLLGLRGAGLAKYHLQRRFGRVKEFRFERAAPPPERAAPAAGIVVNTASSVAAGVPDLLPGGRLLARGLGGAAFGVGSALSAGGRALSGAFGLGARAQGGDAAAPAAPAAEPATPAAPEDAPLPPRLAVHLCLSGWADAPDDSPHRHWALLFGAEGASAPAAAAAAPAPATAAATPTAAPAASPGAKPSAIQLASALATGRCASELLHSHSEAWVVVWESEALVRLGRALSSYLASEAISRAQAELLRATAFSALLAALATPTLLLKAYSLLDNPWAVAEDRAEQVGVLLADVLLARTHGRRPVSLSAFSLGSRAVLACARELDRAGADALGIVEDIVLIGTPAGLHSPDWEAARRVAAGRVVNVHCAWDWILPSVYRAGSPAGALDGIAGLSPVRVRGVQNVDVSELVDGHLAYRASLPLVCARVRETTRPLFVDWAERRPGAAETIQRAIASVPRGVGSGLTALGSALESGAMTTAAALASLGIAIGLAPAPRPALAHSDSAAEGQEDDKS